MRFSLARIVVFEEKCRLLVHIVMLQKCTGMLQEPKLGTVGRAEMHARVLMQSMKTKGARPPVFNARLCANSFFFWVSPFFLFVLHSLFTLSFFRQQLSLYLSPTHRCTPPPVPTLPSGAQQLTFLSRFPTSFRFLSSPPLTCPCSPPLALDQKPLPTSLFFDNGFKNLLCKIPQVHDIAVASNQQVWVVSTRNSILTTKLTFSLNLGRIHSG